jgi:CopA family copper-resistance protein
VFSRVAFSLMLLVWSLSGQAETVSYEFDIDTKTINITGRQVQALAVAGQIPAPTIRAKVGDILRVTFNNKLDETTSVHWHGVLLPSNQDGVPMLNTQPIQPGKSFTFEYPIIQSGTYWYHSHTDLQVQRGVYGSIVLRDAKLPPPALQEQVIVLSDWTNESPAAVLNNLKKDDDYYAYKKNAVQSWDKVIAHGSQAIRNRLDANLARMAPMDLADVGYDAFLANGARESQVQIEDGAAQQMKLRIINGSTSSYFDLEYAGGPMTVVAADGLDVEPVRVQRLRLSTAETYDVLVPVAQHKSFELCATSFDGSGYSSVFLGQGERVEAPELPAPNYYLMSHDSMEMAGDMSMDHAAMGHDMPASDSGQAGAHAGTHTMPAPDQAGTHGATHVMPTSDPAQTGNQADSDPMPLMAMDDAVIPHMTDYRYLVARQSTELPADRPWHEIPITHTGNMARYVWSFNGMTLREEAQWKIQKGDNVRFIIDNDTMMNHPLHLHGHFFRVLNGQGQFSPLKHTVNVPPMGSVVIEFRATENNDWLFHCHNQYHMKTGMNRVISYANTTSFDNDMERAIQPFVRWFRRTEMATHNSFTELDFNLSDERHEIAVQVDADFDVTYEIDATYAYNFHRFFSAFAGIEKREHHHSTNHFKTIAGINVTLPLLVNSEWRVDDHGEFRLELDSDLQLNRRVALVWRWNTEDEYRYALRYNITKRWSISAGTDSEYGDGVGFHYFF